jgi:hypothetical protein
VAETDVSFVIPALNAEATLGVALEAIAGASAGAASEVLLIDNGSRDRTADVARRHGATVVSAPAMSVAALRNLGARLARGSLLAFVDSDCVIAPDWLARAVPRFDDPRVGAVGAPTEVPSDATWVQRAWALHRHRRPHARPVDWLPTENLLVRKAVWQEVGGFNESLATCEDVDFCYRLGAKYTIVSDPAVRSVHLGEAPSLTVFFRKEAWRGAGNLAGFRSHDFRFAEVPSLALPLYHMGAVCGLALGVTVWALTRAALPAVAAAGALAAPSVLMAARTAVQVGQLRAAPTLACVYLTYALARSAAVLPAIGARHHSAQKPHSTRGTPRPAE